MENPHNYQFDEYLLNTVEQSLHRNGERVIINRRTFQVLYLLVERAGEIVSKQEFFDKVWADTFVEDNVLTVTMTALRKALGDNAKHAKFIENLPRKGYRFIAEVKIIDKSLPTVKTESKITGQVNQNSQIKSNIRDQPMSPSKVRKKVVGIFAGCLLVLLFIVGFTYFKFHPLKVSQNKAIEIESIAVMPFENHNPDTEYLSDGLTQSVINNLSGLSNFRVISRNSVFQYKNKSIDLANAGRDLNVNVVLTGRFEQHGDFLNLSVELIDLRDNHRIWGREYHAGVADSFFLQQRISQDVFNSLAQQFNENDRKRIAKRETDNPEAYRLYLRGSYFLDLRTDDNLEKAIDNFNKAIQKDPTYALAYVGLANTYALQADIKINKDELAAMVQAAANKALDIDNSLGEAYAVLAFNNCFHKWDWATAEKQYRRAIELSPNYATAHHWFAEFLAMEGNYDESFAEYKRAVELDPLSLAIKSDLGFNYFYARQPDRAIEYLQNLKKINPNYPRTYFYLAAVFQEKEMFNEAIDELATFYTIQNNNTSIWVTDKDLLKLEVKKGGAKGYWQRMLEFDQNSKTSGPFGLAMLNAKIGDKNKAFGYLEQAYTDRNAGINYIKARPELDGLHSDPRFVDLIRRVGISQ